MKEIKIEKIVLRIGNKEIELSLDEAQSLKDELEKLFGEKTYVYPYYPQPYVYPYSPIVWTTTYWGNTVTYTSGNTMYFGDTGLRTTT